MSRCSPRRSSHSMSATYSPRAGATLKKGGFTSFVLCSSSSRLAGVLVDVSVTQHGVEEFWLHDGASRSFVCTLMLLLLMLLAETRAVARA